MINKVFLNIFCRLFLLVSLPVIVNAHTYYQGITDISINKSEQRIEIVHRFTTHDLEILLSEKYNKKITADLADYSKYLKKYIQNSFELKKRRSLLKLEWIGIENGINETIIYQTVLGLNDLSKIIVNNYILTDFYPEQVNRVNYSDDRLSGTLIFDAKDQTQQIIIE